VAPVLSPRIESELRRIALAERCELLEIEYKGGVLRFILDHPDGVTLEHCESFSKQASALLDVEDVGLGSYVLEVSSPGLDRKLYGARDYHRFSGRLARVTFRAPESGRKRTVVGTLEGFSDDAGGTVAVRERETGERLELPLAAIAQARLEIEL
jgi:ribosome maturation factor RimP